MKDDIVSTSTSLLTSIVPFLLRVGTFVMGLVAIAGGILYVKQDSLLVREKSARCALASFLARIQQCEGLPLTSFSYLSPRLFAYSYTCSGSADALCFAI